MVAGGEANESTPIRGTVTDGWKSAASGAARRLRVRVITHPTALYHMGVSSVSLVSTALALCYLRDTLRIISDT